MSKRPRKSANGDVGTENTGGDGSAAAGDSGDDSSAGNGVIDLAGDVGGTDAGIDPASRPKRAYRKRGTGGARSAQETVSVTAGLSALLYSVHLGVAAITEYEEVQITEPQAEQLAKASAAVMAHYTDVQMPAKVLDWGNLFSALASVYIPMGMAISMRRAKDRANQPIVAPVSQTPRPSQAQGAEPSGVNVVEIPGLGKVERFDT